MRLLDIALRAGRSLRQAKTRTALTVLAIAVGGFAIAVSLAVGEGARQYTSTVIASNLNPQSITVARDKAFFGGGQNSSAPQEYDENAISEGMQGRVIKQVTTQDIQTLQQIDGVAQVVPYYTLQAKYVTTSASAKKYTASVQSYDSSIKITTLAAGQLPPLNTQIADGTAVIPESFVSALGFANAADAMNKTITLHFERAPQIDQTALKQAMMMGDEAKITALTQPQKLDKTVTITAITKPSPTQQSASSGIFISQNDAKALDDFSKQGTTAAGKYQLVTVLAKDGVSPEIVKERIEKDGMTAKTAADLQQFLFTFVNILQGIVSGFGVIALIASVFGIINTMYISVLERTQQIGLMKALGARSRAVMGMFLIEAGWIGVLGGVVGIGLAFAAGMFANPIVTDKLNLGAGNSLFVFEWWQMAILLGGLVCVAMVSGFMPARKAAKLDPIEALRTE